MRAKTESLGIPKHKNPKTRALKKTNKKECKKLQNRDVWGGRRTTFFQENLTMAPEIVQMGPGIQNDCLGLEKHQKIDLLDLGNEQKNDHLAYKKQAFELKTASR